MNKLRLSILIVIICFFSVSQELAAQDLNLMPVPANVVQTGEKFRLTETFTLDLQGFSNERTAKAATRMLRRLAGRTGFFLPQDIITADDQPETPSMIIEFTRAGNVVLNEDESYSLTVLPDKIRLNAETDIGIIRGLETFLQLLDADSEGYFIHGVIIRDKPRFPWRGLLIDVSRHFMPVDIIKRNLDAMAAVKLNVLHLHLSEDQGFRVECKTFPKLHQLGSDGMYYTHEQIKDIIEYAAGRGIRVMPEFDMPGHTTSWFTAYPEYASLPGPYGIERKWGIMDPAFDPTNDDLYKFLDKFFKEMADLFTDEYMHVGGDENNGKQWAANEEIQNYMKKNDLPDKHALQRYFNQRILKILTKYNKKMIGWDEIFQPELPKDIVIQSWRGKKAMVDAAKKGYQTLLSNGYYIDLIQPADFHYLNDPLPADSPLSEAEKKFILGGEATMWAEYISPATIDSRIWPRTAAIAERFWSSGDVKNVEDMYKRLDVISFQLEELGITHIKNKEMFLRRLTNNNDTSSLRILMDVIEPLKGYRRGRFKDYRSSSPLTRVVDAAHADAKGAREFRNMVDIFLDNSRNDRVLYETIKQKLLIWKKNHAELEEIIKKSPALNEIRSLSEDLSTVSAIALDAIDFLENRRQADKGWIESKLQVLKNAKEQRGQTELMIIPPVEKLVNAAGGK